MTLDNKFNSMRSCSFGVRLLSVKSRLNTRLISSWFWKEEGRLIGLEKWQDETSGGARLLALR